MRSVPPLATLVYGGVPYAFDYACPGDAGILLRTSGPFEGNGNFDCPDLDLASSLVFQGSLDGTVVSGEVLDNGTTMADLTGTYDGGIFEVTSSWAMDVDISGMVGTMTFDLLIQAE